MAKISIPYPRRLALAQVPTPLQPLDRLSSELGGPRIWVKRDDLTGNLLSGNKVRKLDFVVAEALARGCDTLITCGGLQSNHCRATAWIGARLGLKVHLILRGEPRGDADGNLLLDHLAGATVSTYPAAKFFSDLPDLFLYWQRHYRQRGNSPFLIPTGASDEIGVWGYIDACRELRDDFLTNHIVPKYTVVATGSGGTHAGLAAGNHLYGLGTRVVGFAVCDSEAYFKSKVKQDLLSWRKRYRVNIDLDGIDIHVNDRYIGPGYGKATKAVFETIKWVARHEGLAVEPVYTGKALHGLITEIKNGNLNDTEDIVFVHTGGVFGLFAYKQPLLEVL